MRVLKVLFCALICALSVFFARAPQTTAHAASDVRYARADSRSVYFCASEDLSSARFLIPYTYCVRILADRGDWYKVSYAEDAGIYRKVEGFCPKEGLTEIEEPPEKVFLNLPVTITFRVNKPSDGALGTLGNIEVTAAYYGEYVSGATSYSYVYYNGEFGYIDDVDADYELNPLPNKPQKEENGGSAKIITVIVITALAVTAVAVLYLTGRKPKIENG